MHDDNVALLDLPYDVRHLIYKHLFPPLRQIYILAGDDALQLMNHNHKIPVSVLRVNRQMHEETAAFMYNNYLFNIVGRKQDCLKLYKPFLHTFSTHARQPARLDAFTNGDHSATSCLSIQSGETQLHTLESRRRGTSRTLEQLQDEVSAQDELITAPQSYSFRTKDMLSLACIVALFAIILAIIPISHMLHG